MMEELIKKIDELIKKIKYKGDKERFTFEDSRIIICCEIIRLELKESNEVSDLSFGAFNSITGNSYQTYRGIEDEIHELILKIDDSLYLFNKNEFKGDIYVPYAQDKERWFRYFGGAIRCLLEKKQI